MTCATWECTNIPPNVLVISLVALVTVLLIMAVVVRWMALYIQPIHLTATVKTYFHNHLFLITDDEAHFMCAHLMSVYDADECAKSWTTMDFLPCLTLQSMKHLRKLGLRIVSREKAINMVRGKNLMMIRPSRTPGQLTLVVDRKEINQVAEATVIIREKEVLVQAISEVAQKKVEMIHGTAYRSLGEGNLKDWRVLENKYLTFLN